MPQAETYDEYIGWFDDLTNDHVARLGGKNASLGEMIRELREESVRVPGGFATTTSVYRRFLESNQLENRIREQLGRLDKGAV